MEDKRKCIKFDIALSQSTAFNSHNATQQYNSNLHNSYSAFPCINTNWRALGIEYHQALRACKQLASLHSLYIDAKHTTCTNILFIYTKHISNICALSMKEIRLLLLFNDVVSGKNNYTLINCLGCCQLHHRLYRNDRIGNFLIINILETA